MKRNTEKRKNPSQDPRAGHFWDCIQGSDVQIGGLGCSGNGCNCTQSCEIWLTPNCHLYVFGSSRKHFISTHSLPTVFIRANPRDLRSSPSSSDPICSSLLLLLSRCGLHSPSGKRFVGPIALKTIAIAKCPDNRDCHWHWPRVATTTATGQTRSICVNIWDLFWELGLLCSSGRLWKRSEDRGPAFHHLLPQFWIPLLVKMVVKSPGKPRFSSENFVFTSLIALPLPFIAWPPKYLSQSDSFEDSVLQVLFWRAEQIPRNSCQLDSVLPIFVVFLWKHPLGAEEMSEVVGVLECLCFPGSWWWYPALQWGLPRSLSPHNLCCSGTI